MRQNVWAQLLMRLTERKLNTEHFLVLAASTFMYLNRCTLVRVRRGPRTPLDSLDAFGELASSLVMPCCPCVKGKLFLVRVTAVVLPSLSVCLGPDGTRCEVSWRNFVQSISGSGSVGSRAVVCLFRHCLLCVPSLVLLRSHAVDAFFTGTWGPCVFESWFCCCWPKGRFARHVTLRVTHLSA